MTRTMLPGTSPAALHLARTLLARAYPQAAVSAEGRLAARHGWLTWAPPPGPLVWVHAASVGEALTATPVLIRLRAARANLRVALTYTSPSLARWPGSLVADRADYLPPDDRTTMEAVFQHLHPAVVVFARGDVWPGVVKAARRHGIPVVLIGGTVRPASRRLRGPARLVLGNTYQSLAWCGAVSPADADRLGRLGVTPRALRVTGDPRHDQVIERPVSLTWPLAVLRWAAGHAVTVAGSTHPEDERVLLPAFGQVLNQVAGARLVLVPHTTDNADVQRISRAAAALGLTHAPLSLNPPPKANLLVGTGLGILADLYAAAMVAYVGGGFGGRLHAVAEPAAFGVPVMFGRQHPGDWPADAEALLQGGGGVVESGGGVAELAGQWLRWLRHPAVACGAGLAARGSLTDGAAGTTCEAILQLLNDAPLEGDRTRYHQPGADGGEQ
ncbi:MAG TPA: glycosyltransferase N-terminal domain-containing protein [Gemmatimonadales bacterium]|nr:glycosyltransferase N-terminal domain-containing protein [Gemmatimonadales bacterium]